MLGRVLLHKEHVLVTAAVGEGFTLQDDNADLIVLIEFSSYCTGSRPTWDPKNGLTSMLTGYELHRECMELSQNCDFHRHHPLLTIQALRNATICLRRASMRWY